MQLHHLAFKGAGHHPFAQALEAVHLGLHQATSVVAAPDFPQASPKTLASEHRLVSVGRARTFSLSNTGVFARWNQGLRPSLGNRIKATPRVIRTVCTDTGDSFVGQDFCQQLRQHGSVTNSVTGDFDGPYLPRLSVYTEVNLALCAAVLGPVLLAFPFAFTQELDARAIDQQVERLRARTVAQLHLQALWAATDGAEIWHQPVEP